MEENTDSTEQPDYSIETADAEGDPSNHERKICFALLVHNRREIVIDLLDNLRYYCPNSSIVLFNGGDDPELCEGLGYPVCPTSRKLVYGVTAVYMLEVMKWLEDTGEEYDYLINLDSDVFFLKKGYESFIIDEMKDKDYMGVGNKVPDDDFYCLLQLRHEKRMWEPLLGKEPYIESFNVGQVYSRTLVQRILSSEQYRLLHKNLLKTQSFGVDELVYATLVDRLGIQVHSYPKEMTAIIRYRPHFPLDEVIHYLNKKPHAHLLHPLYRRMKDEARVAIRELMKREIQRDPTNHASLLDKDLGLLPYMLRREKYNGTTIEWIAASPQEGMLYWKEKTGTYYGPYSFGKGKVKGITALESSFGNIEVLCWIDHRLVHYWRDDETGEWLHEDSFAEGITGMPSFIQSSYGSFEVVAPLEGGGLGHWWRNNDDPDHPWFGPTKFGTSHYQDAILVENNSRQLTAIALQDEKYHYFVRDDRNSWQWFGPYE